MQMFSSSNLFSSVDGFEVKPLNVMICLVYFCKETHSRVVRLAAPHMGGTVHQPGEVQVQHVAQYALRVERPEERLVPTVDRDHRRQNEAQQQFQLKEIPACTQSPLLRALSTATRKSTHF